jgi:hypothetical protein
VSVVGNEVLRQGTSPRELCTMRAKARDQARRMTVNIAKHPDCPPFRNGQKQTRSFKEGRVGVVQQDTA